MTDLQRWQKRAAAAFFLQGAGSTLQKALTELQGEYKALFSLCLYGTALVLALGLYWGRRHHHLSWIAAAAGGGAGVTGIVALYCSLLALRQLPGVVVFTVIPTCSLALTLLAGTVLFKERLSSAQWLGIGCALAGIVLVQL